jgi:flagellar motor switch protein FliN/FliY
MPDVDEDKTSEQAVEPQHRSAPRPATFPQVEDKSRAGAPRGVTVLGDVNLHMTIRLGTTGMLVKDIVELRTGSVVELDKLAGEQMDLYINDVFFAKGEVLVIGDTLSIRITEIAGQEELDEDAED